MLKISRCVLLLWLFIDLCRSESVPSSCFSLQDDTNSTLCNTVLNVVRFGLKELNQRSNSNFQLVSIVNATYSPLKGSEKTILYNIKAQVAPLIQCPGISCPFDLSQAQTIHLLLSSASANNIALVAPTLFIETSNNGYRFSRSVIESTCLGVGFLMLAFTLVLHRIRKQRNGYATIHKSVQGIPITTERFAV